MGWAGFSRTLSSRGVECRAGRGSCETLPRSTTRSPVVPCMRRAGAVGESTCPRSPPLSHTRFFAPRFTQVRPGHPGFAPGHPGIRLGWIVPSRPGHVPRQTAGQSSDHLTRPIPLYFPNSLLMGGLEKCSTGQPPLCVCAFCA